MKTTSGIAAAVLLTTTLLAPLDASATAVASVEENFFTLRPTWGSVNGANVGNPSATMPGIAISVASQTFSKTEIETNSGDVGFSMSASSNGALLAAGATADPGGYAFGSYLLEVTFAFTNLSGLDFDFLTIRTDFSSFNPGGPSIGAQVDNSAFEYAAFLSSQTGKGIGDFHQCDTRANLPGGQTFPSTPPAARCGVGSPDSSQLEYGLLDFDQNETLYETYTLRVVVEASSIDEPASLALMGAALIGLIGLRRRQGSWPSRGSQMVSCH